MSSSSSSSSRDASAASAPQAPFCTNTRPTTHPTDSGDIDRLIEHVEALSNRFSDGFGGFARVLVARIDRLEEHLVAAIEGGKQ